MEDKIINETEETGTGEIKEKDGKLIKVKTKTIYTNYESGRKDCAVHVFPITSGTQLEKIFDDSKEK